MKLDAAKYILGVFIMDIIRPASWGIHNASRTPEGVRFSVDGFLHKGDVEVDYLGDATFTVRILGSNGKIKNKVEGIYVDGLIETIDKLVEHCSDYEDRVAEEYGLNR